MQLQVKCLSIDEAPVIITVMKEIKQTIVIVAVTNNHMIISYH